MSKIRLLLVGLFALYIGQLCFEGAATMQTLNQSAAPPYSSDKPMSEPVLFARDIVSTADYESHPAFTPDGRTLYFLKSTPDFGFWTIVVTRFNAGRWSTPEVAPFSGRDSDADPFITADGSRLFFISNRPVPGKTKRDMDIWVMEKTGSGWSEPKNIGAPVNSDGNEWYPTLASDGTIYFGSDRAGGKGRTDIYRSRLVDGKYSEPENLGENINTQFNEFEPYISPDQRFLIFMAGGRPDGLGGYDLYLSYNRQGAWSKAINLGPKVNSSGSEFSPVVAPGGKYFFWSSTRGFAGEEHEKHFTYQELVKRLRQPGNGLGDIYQIDLSALRIEP